MCFKVGDDDENWINERGEERLRGRKYELLIGVRICLFLAILAAALIVIPNRKIEDGRSEVLGEDGAETAGCNGNRGASDGFDE